MKRYILMKLVDYNVEEDMQTWKFLTLGAEDPYELNNFMSNGYRIYDNVEQRVIKTNLDLHKWLADNSS
ncbi:hypothetical protein DN757_01895 [Paenibacillus silvae]|uniref:Uncharacterized protein n=1 Tax=Paenibacillus silvae TaxID=1325358 RepID=A0A2W6NNM8_9BACL|nr:hypothetical protein DN757_01895 [Paenibacillus silvae]